MTFTNHQRWGVIRQSTATDSRSTHPRLFAELYLMRKPFSMIYSWGFLRTFPRADIGIDHDMVMMTFRVRVKGAKQFQLGET